MTKFPAFLPGDVAECRVDYLSTFKRGQRKRVIGIHWHNDRLVLEFDMPKYGISTYYADQFDNVRNRPSFLEPQLSLDQRWTNANLRSAIDTTTQPKEKSMPAYNKNEPFYAFPSDEGGRPVMGTNAGLCGHLYGDNLADIQRKIAAEPTRRWALMQVVGSATPRPVETHDYNFR